MWNGSLMHGWNSAFVRSQSRSSSADQISPLPSRRSKNSANHVDAPSGPLRHEGSARIVERGRGGSQQTSPTIPRRTMSSAVCLMNPTFQISSQNRRRSRSNNQSAPFAKSGMSCREIPFSCAQVCAYNKQHLTTLAVTEWNRGSRFWACCRDDIAPDRSPSPPALRVSWEVRQLPPMTGRRRSSLPQSL